MALEDRKDGDVLRANLVDYPVVAHDHFADVVSILLWDVTSRSGHACSASRPRPQEASNASRCSWTVFGNESFGRKKACVALNVQPSLLIASACRIRPRVLRRDR